MAGRRNGGGRGSGDGEDWTFRRVRGVGEVPVGVGANRPGGKRKSPRKEPRLTKTASAKKAAKKSSVSGTSRNRSRGLRAERLAPRRATSERRLLGRFGYALTVLTLWGGIAAGGVIFYYTLLLPDASSLWDIERTPGLTVIAADGEVLTSRGELFGGRASIDEMPKYLIDAVLATEDRYFYYHFGLDPVGLGRAMVANFKAGALVQGGSTITQQLAKNLFLKPDRTWQRKVQELILAFWLEARFSKDQILALYLNRVYFGAGAYGIEAAAQRYFNKSVRDVSLSEAAMLVGLLKAPSRYAPTNDLNLAQARAATVLANMRRVGYITGDEAVSAFDRPASLAGYGGSGSINYFVDWMVDGLPDHAGQPNKALVVTSTIDPFLQKKAEAVVEEALTRDGEKLDVTQAALLAMTPDGAVRAMVGGRSYAKSQFNRATQARRQPGSAFKPVVYLAALEYGLTPDTMRLDAPITVEGWSPSNYSDDHQGAVTLTQAMARSINTVTVRVSEEVGRERVIGAARRLGIQADLAPRPSIALGTFEVSLLELASAYAPFANGGYGVIPYGIDKAATVGGEEVYVRQGSGVGRVVNPAELGAMNHMLSEVMHSGTGRKAALKGRPAAGKTGTSQGFRDAWFVGYTADLVVAVWVGNDNGAPMRKVTGGGLPAVMWHDFMHRTQRDTRVAALPGSYEPLFESTGAIAPQPDEDRRAWEVPGFFERLFGLDTANQVAAGSR